MVTDFRRVFGREKNEGPEPNGPSFKMKKFQKQPAEAEDEKMPAPEEENKMSQRKLIVAIDGFTEKQARHMKGDVLKIEIDEERAAALIKAGYIYEEEIAKKVEEKAIEAPIQKIVTGEDTENKGVTGKGAGLLNKKKR